MASAHATPLPSGSGTDGSGLRRVTVVLVGIVTIIAFEAMSISTVMPAVAADLHAGDAYALAFSLMFTAQLVGIVVAPAMIDARGMLVTTWTGLALFAAGSALAGAAPALWVLLVGRLLAGFGAGLVIVALYVIIGRVYPDGMRPRVFGWISSAWVVPSVVGPLLAAWLTQALSWRSVFLVVLPVIAVIVVTTWRHRALLTRPASGRATAIPDPEHPDPPERSPITGAERSAEAQSHRRTAARGLLVGLGAALFQWAGGRLVPVSLFASACAIAGLCAVALGAARLVPAGTARLRRGLPSVMAARFLGTAAFNGAVTFVPLFLVSRWGLSIAQAGVILALVSVGWAAGSLGQGHRALAGRSSVLVCSGGALLALSLSGAVVTGLRAPSGGPAGTAVFVLLMVVCGLGMGLAMSSMSVLTLDLAAPGRHAQASSSLQLSDVLGSVMGISVCGVVFAASTGPGGSSATGGAGGPGNAVFAVMWAITAGIALLAAVAGWRTRPDHRRREGSAAR